MEAQLYEWIQRWAHEPSNTDADWQIFHDFHNRQNLNTVRCELSLKEKERLSEEEKKVSAALGADKREGWDSVT